MLGDAVTYLSFPGKSHQDNYYSFDRIFTRKSQLNHPSSTVWETHPKPLAPQAMRPFALHWRCHGLAPGWDFWEKMTLVMLPGKKGWRIGGICG